MTLITITHDSLSKNDVSFKVSDNTYFFFKYRPVVHNEPMPYGTRRSSIMYCVLCPSVTKLFHVLFRYCCDTKEWRNGLHGTENNSMLIAC